MSEIETLSQGEVELLANHLADGALAEKALRIIEQQAKRIGDLEALLAHLQEDLSKTLFLRDETRAKQAKRIVTLEAQVLASETVSKAEYTAMVEQRNTMREELKAARLRIEQLQDTGKLAELEARAELAREVADNCSGDYMRAILDGEIDRAEHESRHL